MSTRNNWLTRLPRAVLLGGVCWLVGGTSFAQSGLETTGRFYLEGARQSELGYSRAVVTRGGDVVWLSGMSGPRDARGELITDFAEQVRQAFRNLDATLRELGSDVSDVVSITVLLRDPRYYDIYAEVRKEFFPDGRYPASTIVNDTSFARPEVMVLLQAVAVVNRSTD